MKKLVLTVVATLALSVPAAFAADHAKHVHGAAAHEEIITGVKATFTVQTMADAMKAMGLKMPAGVKETHHISVEFKDTRTGKPLTSGEVKVKLLAPDKTEQVKDLAGMQGHFGGDFVMSQKGKYGVMAKYKAVDGTVRQLRFWYTPL